MVFIRMSRNCQKAAQAVKAPERRDARGTVGDSSLIPSSGTPGEGRVGVL